jgi:hypothetical protein
VISVVSETAASETHSDRTHRIVKHFRFITSSSFDFVSAESGFSIQATENRITGKDSTLFMDSILFEKTAFA